MDRASDFGSDGWEFESLRAHTVVFGLVRQAEPIVPRLTEE